MADTKETIDTKDIELKLNDHDHEISSLKHRMDESEEQQKSINSLAQSVNELAINMRYMFEEQKKQGERLLKLEQEPSDNYKHYKRLIFGCVITGIIGTFLGAIFALIFK